jgi:type IV fimbrial biogenesis protein FimT
MNTRQHGFTLWELLMTLLVAGILLGIGVPNLMEFQRNSLVIGAANDLVTAALMARTEAVKRQSPVGWCLTDDPLAATPTCVQAFVLNSTTRGYVVWVDENNNFDADGNRIVTDVTDGNAVIDAGELVIRRTTHPGGRVLLSAGCGYASFTPMGALRQVGTHCVPNAPAAANPRIVLFCDDRGRRPSTGNVSSARVVRIDALGRANVYTETADVAARITGTFVGPFSGVTCPP